MKKKILITSFDLSVGGIERSLLGLLETFDYTKYDLDLMLFSHTGEFMAFLPKNGYNLLPEIPEYATFRQGIAQMAKKHPFLAIRRLSAKRAANKTVKVAGKLPEGMDVVSFCAVQKYWDYSISALPKLSGEYDVAISFMWPHHFTATKVNAKKKIAWIHSDYTKAFYDREGDEKIWSKFDKIVGVSEECRASFCEVFPKLEKKTTVVENLLSQEFVRKQAEAPIDISDMDFSGEETSILSVGRFTYAKAFEVIPMICRKMLDDGYEVKWFLAGFGGDEGLIRQKIREYNVENNVIIIGKKLNVYPYMKKADIYAQPSRYEGKAVTVREAQMLGKAVIITDFNTARSQVEDGVDALICGIEPEETAKAIEKLIDSPNEKKRLESNAYSRNYGNLDEIEKVYALIEEE